MTAQWHGGKGSKPRPYSVDQKTFESNWDNIFKKKNKEEKEKTDKNDSSDEKNK